MTLTDFLDHIITILRARFPELASCETHPGTFDLDELKRFATLTPALRIACLGLSRVEIIATDEREATLNLAAFAVTSDRAGLSRDRASLNLVEALAVELPRQRWGLDYVHPAEAVKARNLYGGKLGMVGTSLWAVSWEQVVRLGTDIWDGDDVLPVELYASWEPNTGPEHEEDYVLLEQLPDAL